MGSLSFSITVLSSSVSSPTVVKTTSRPRSVDKSRTSRLNLLKVAPMGTILIFMVLSRNSALRRSTSSARNLSCPSSPSFAIWVSRACTVTSSPTRLTSSSSFDDGTRILDSATGFCLLCSLTFALAFFRCSCSRSAASTFASEMRPFSTRISPRRF